MKHFRRSITLFQYIFSHLLFQNEQPIYRTFTAGELKTIVGRKWKYREGTLEEKDRNEEVKEAVIFPTQDAIIEHMFKLKKILILLSWLLIL